MKANPYAPPRDALTTRPRSAIYLLLFATLSFAIVYAAWSLFGISGIAPAVAFITVCWFTLSRTVAPKLDPINRQRMTVVELLTIVIICAILHGLTLPSVSTTPRRPSSVAPQAPNTQSIRSDSVPSMNDTN
ncbi:hypothetical protein [Planctomycetes bacterium CA13]